MNSPAGGSSFTPFRALIALGIPPIATNTCASCAGHVSGAVGFRRELWAHRYQFPSVAYALIGGGVNGWILMQTAAATVSRAIPWFLLFATSITIWGDALHAHLRRKFPHLGGYAAASAVRVVSQRLVRRAITVVAAAMTAYFFIAS